MSLTLNDADMAGNVEEVLIRLNGGGCEPKVLSKVTYKINVIIRLNTAEDVNHKCYIGLRL